MPVLILHGLADRAVNPEDARLLERAIREGGNRKVEVRLFPGVTHQFQHALVDAREDDAPLPTQDLAPEVLDALCSWLRATLARR
jgi:dipeptidyl aminopeptidase/acylaminoacyl peptidase